MSKLKRLSGDEVIRRLEKLGYQRMPQRGSHVVLKKQKSEGEIERLD
jgi:predicted RNA binding protein YcfA (HicA-like mRNA interferase family)